MSRTAPRIVVVGAGIVGASIAWHLARRGAKVTLVDRSQPGSGVTSRAFAWINVSHGQPEPYQQLRHLAIHEYRRLEHELKGALGVDWCGALTWTRDAAATERFAREHAAAGYDVRLLGRTAVARQEPGLADPPEVAAFAASEGAIDPLAAATVLAAAAREEGAELRLDSEVTALIPHGGRLAGVHTSGGTIEADVVVMAAGIGSDSLCEQVGALVPIDDSPALLLRFRASRGLVRTIVSNPAFEVRQGTDGELLAAEDYADGDDAEAIARSSLVAIRAGLHGADRVELASATVGRRPIPADGLPIVGFGGGIEGLYIASMHAGITLAPVIGRFAATEILDEVEVALLASCRLARFGT